VDRRLIIPPVSPAAPGALYEQIVAGFKKEISAGRLEPGSALPSFRTLAEDLLVSVITVKRAYEELEREGIIFRKQGLGTFVAAQGDNRTREGKEEAARRLFEKAVIEGIEAGLSAREISELFKEILNQKEKKQ
jgi:GntR family transcriptional regulator